ncbi:MAG: hypothetical protein HRT61_00765 [Ekhidna sp.]|nr:hypothetical protein [Ekhidna sp.]
MKKTFLSFYRRIFNQDQIISVDVVDDSCNGFVAIHDGLEDEESPLFVINDPKTARLLSESLDQAARYLESKQKGD